MIKLTENKKIYSAGDIVRIENWMDFSGEGLVIKNCFDWEKTCLCKLYQAPRAVWVPIENITKIIEKGKS